MANASAPRRTLVCRPMAGSDQSPGTLAAKPARLPTREPTCFRPRRFHLKHAGQRASSSPDMPAHDGLAPIPRLAKWNPLPASLTLLIATPSVEQMETRASEVLWHMSFRQTHLGKRGACSRSGASCAVGQRRPEQGPCEPTPHPPGDIFPAAVRWGLQPEEFTYHPPPPIWRTRCGHRPFSFRLHARR